MTVTWVTRKVQTSVGDVGGNDLAMTWYASCSETEEAPVDVTVSMLNL